MQNWISRRALSQQLQVSLLLVLLLGIALFVGLLRPQVNELLKSDAERSYLQQRELAVGLLDSTSTELKSKAQLAMAALRAQLRGRAPEEMASEQVDAVADLDPGIVATVFLKEDRGFVRHATSVTTQAGGRAVGTALPPEGDVALALQSGQSIQKLVNLFGKDYWALYSPLRAGNGSITGALFVGVDARASLDKVKSTLLAMRVGRTGYFYAYGIDGEHKGELLVHPKIVGKNLLTSANPAESSLMKEMLTQKTGSHSYAWTNPGETQAREKFVAFTEFPEWGWGVAASAYTDDLTADLDVMLRNAALTQLAVTALVLVVLFAMVKIFVTKPLHQIVLSLRQMEQGILPTVPLVTGSSNELHQLNNSLSKAVEGLTTLVGTAHVASEQVGVGAEQLASANGELAVRTETQAALVERTASTARGLANEVAESAKAAQDTHSLVAEASSQVESGSKTVMQAVLALQDIQVRAQEVSSIVEQIDKIATQSHLLALNASIEAARAGVAGKGFAVVAQEVRKLSSDTKQAAHLVQELVVKSVASAGAGATLVSQAGVIIQGTSTAFQQVKQAADHSLQVTQAQAQEIFALQQSLGNLDAMTQQNAAMVEEVAAASGNLSSHAKVLRAAVQTFRKA